MITWRIGGGMVAIVLLASLPAQSQTAVATLRELVPALTACWRAPSGASDRAVTVSFSLNRDGGVIGKPRIAWSRLGADETQNREFIGSVMEALGRCTPVRLTPGLGAAIAGRPLRVMFGRRAPSI